jgi:hypothetical protein
VWLFELYPAIASQREKVTSQSSHYLFEKKLVHTFNKVSNVTQGLGIGGLL